MLFGLQYPPRPYSHSTASSGTASSAQLLRIQKAQLLRVRTSRPVNDIYMRRRYRQLSKMAASGGTQDLGHSFFQYEPTEAGE